MYVINNYYTLLINAEIIHLKYKRQNGILSQFQRLNSYANNLL